MFGVKIGGTVPTKHAGIPSAFLHMFAVQIGGTVLNTKTGIPTCFYIFGYSIGGTVPSNGEHFVLFL